MSAYIGDCGRMKLMGSVLVSGAVLGLFAGTKVIDARSTPVRTLAAIAAGCAVMALSILLVQSEALYFKHREWSECLERTRPAGALGHLKPKEKTPEWPCKPSFVPALASGQRTFI